MVRFVMLHRPPMCELLVQGRKYPQLAVEHPSMELIRVIGATSSRHKTRNAVHWLYYAALLEGEPSP